MNMAPSFAPSFADARPVAQHCAELTWRGPRPEERAEHVAAWCRDLSAELAQELGQLFSGVKLQITMAEPEIVAGKVVFERIGPVAANSLLRCGGGDQTMLFSLDYPTAIALTDCSFGGNGEPSGDVPAQLPRSAALLVEKLASIIAQTIAMSNGSSETVIGDVLVRSESVTRLKPFSSEAQVAFFPIKITMGTAGGWSAALAVANERLDSLLPGANSAPNSDANKHGVSTGTKGPFAGMPLPLEAVLGEVTMSLSRLSKLTPGDELPIAVGGELPLRVGEETIAHGALGTVENRMALRVTRLPGPAQIGAFTQIKGAQQ